MAQNDDLGQLLNLSRGTAPPLTWLQVASRWTPLDTAAIFSTTMEGILYGFSVLMFMGTIWALTYKQHMKDINRPIAVVAILLLTLSTAHMIVDIIRIEQGLVTYRDTFPGGPSAFFADVAQETFVIKNAIYTLQAMLSDGILIYRCYVIWQTVWVIIVPSLKSYLLFPMEACGFCAVYSISQASSGAAIFAKATGQWITAFYSMTFATNLLASGLIVYRIWTIERNVSAIRTTKSTLMPIVHVLVDAAILYSVALFSALVCFTASNNGQYIMLDMIMPIISIAFYMVIIRIAINKRTSSYLPTASGGTSATTPGNSRRYPMRPLQVHISQLAYNDDTSSYKTGKVEVKGASYSV
ncbi:hypothetical protein DFJ58DRAFT_793152 [Suillus subalutaceus]|uniref:uncharacterized protein n=1 Tax=Suillus subalutaceus TaxID=48586 RepID=UPI001B884B48|nr:uncharacterized protein DFJ58DRAFT_793152 [Suillus subalutaceus]KAG1850809.1 hypothetical protein DFJ58DRAFT_793152 [Suillus subalutaceus]